MERKLRVVILTGTDSTAACMTIVPLLSIPEVEVSAILFDTNPQTLHRRYKNLKRNIKRECWGYLPYRALSFIIKFLDARAASVIPDDEVRHLLRKALPEKYYSLSDLAQAYRIPIIRVQNLNSTEAICELRKLEADLGIVLGTRVLKRSTFSVPKLGSINLHKGKVPEFRGMPPGFWELYVGAFVAGTTVHFVDDLLDTGDIIGESTVVVHPNDTPTTLARKLDISGTELLARVLKEIASGKITRKKQTHIDLKPRTSPTRKEWRRLHQRLGLPLTNEGISHAVKTMVYLLLFHSRIWHLVRALRSGGRGSVLLYHRVNDLCEDCLTTSCKRFAEQLVLLRRYYHVISSTDLVEMIRSGAKIPAHSVVIHFDDCYRDVYTNAAQLLYEAHFPACAFISSGFVGTNRRFAHDESKYSIPLQNLTATDVRGLRALNMEVGSHTVNHANLGWCTPEQASYELRQSKRDVEDLVGEPVVLFSYPYGKASDVRPETAQLAKEAGYTAMFSAYGGHVNWKTSLFDIPRFGIDDDSCGLELLMEIEGLSFGQLRHNLFRQRGSELCLTTTGRWRTKTRGLNESTGYES